MIVVVFGQLLPQLMATTYTIESLNWRIATLGTFPLYCRSLHVLPWHDCPGIYVCLAVEWIGIVHVTYPVVRTFEWFFGQSMNEQVDEKVRRAQEQLSAVIVNDSKPPPQDLVACLRKMKLTVDLKEDGQLSPPEQATYLLSHYRSGSPLIHAKKAFKPPHEIAQFLRENGVAIPNWLSPPSATDHVPPHIQCIQNILNPLSRNVSQTNIAEEVSELEVSLSDSWSLFDSSVVKSKQFLGRMLWTVLYVLCESAKNALRLSPKSTRP